MQKYINSAFSSRPVMPLKGAEVTVTTSNGDLATLYSDNAGTLMGNPIYTDDGGNYSFYAADGRYTITITKTGFQTQVLADVLLEDPADGSAALLSSAGSSLIGFIQSGAGAVARTAQDEFRDRISVKQFGAKGDGSTDDTTSIQAALDAAVGASVGKAVYFPSGQYVVNGTLTVNSKTALIGDASGSVRIKQTNASATLIKSANFDALTGTSSGAGVRRVTLRDLTLEATVSSGSPTGTTTQHGVQIYGYGCTFENIHIRGFGGIGLNPEWAAPGTSPDSGYDDGFTENRLIAVKVYECGLSGIKCDGANDGQWFGVISYSNNHADVSPDKPNVWITAKGNPQYIDQLHAWGNSSGTALLLEGSATCSNCALEGATNVQLKIKTGEVVFNGGLIFAAGSSSSIGIQFVGGTGVCIGYEIDTSIEGCNGGSVDFGTGIDAHKISLRAYQTSGTVQLGTIPTAGAGKSYSIDIGGGANNRGSTRRSYSSVVTNFSLTGAGDIGFEYADHGGEGVIALPQRKTEPASTFNPTSGLLGYARSNAFRFHQVGAGVGTLMGEPATAITPVDNLDVSFYQLNTLAPAGSSVTINNFSKGLVGSPFLILLPNSGAGVTIGTAGNIRTKSGSSITQTASKQLLTFCRSALDGLYYQV